MRGKEEKRGDASKTGEWKIEKEVRDNGRGCDTKLQAGDNADSE